MTSLEKAKAYFQANGKKLALAVAPLAMAAVSAIPAHAATVVFTPVTASGFGTGNFASGGGTLTGGQLPLWNGISGVTYTGSAYAQSSGGSAGVAFNFSGGGSGTFAGGLLPVDYDFTLSPSNGGVVDWQVIYTIGGSSGGPNSVTFSGGTASLAPGGTATVSGAGSLAETSNLAFYQVQFQATWIGGNGDQLNVGFPSGSLDLAPTPEPATLFFAGPGLAFLILRARRKSRA